MDIEVLRRLLNQQKLEPYIRHIRFPQYKNVEPFTKIDFTFPITALVGANGTNKSSLLRALYGAPGNNNLGNYWFSTEIDPIVEGDQFPNCFVYGYFNSYTNNIVEVLKTRVKKEGDPDYWEPSRPIQRYEMDKMPTSDGEDPNRSKTRWKAISKNVEIIDFRHALSAFDRYFYYGDFSREKTFSEKKTFIRSRAPHLKAALDGGRDSYPYYGVERIVNRDNSSLSNAEINAVKDILGRSYDEVRLICHKFFRGEGFTARIASSDFQYTEAFAGSGEFAVIMLVTRVMRSVPNSLILLDEPEVSLHPGAQEKLLEFLGKQVIKNKYQIVFTTHSPSLIRGLPHDAIKVLALDRHTSRVVLTGQKAIPEEAFLRIGEPISGQKTIVAEDRLAIEIIKRAIRIHAPQLLKLLKFIFFPGGASVIFKHHIPSYVAENRQDIFCLLDGDQRPELTWPDNNKLTQVHDEELGKLVQNLTGCDIKFPINSGTQVEKEAQTNAAQREFLAWGFSNIRYLPGLQGPEEFILSKIGEGNVVNAKLHFVKLTRASLGLTDDEDDPDGDAIFQEQCRRIAEIPSNDVDIKNLSCIIQAFLTDGTE